VQRQKRAEDLSWLGTDSHQYKPNLERKVAGAHSGPW
jgi:hypothetical protein